MLTETPPAATPETPATPAPAAPEEPKKTAFEARLEELRAPAEAPADPAAPPAGDPPADPAAEVVPEAGAPSTEAEDEASPGAEPEEQPGGAAIVAKLPGQRPGDPDFEFTIDEELREVLVRKGIDPEQLAERTRMATNGVMRRREFETAREAIQADRTELDTVEDALRTDPSGWMVQRIPEPLRQQAARDLLLSLTDEGWEAVMVDAAKWDQDRSARAKEATDLENKRLRAEQQRRQQKDERGQDTQAAQKIGEAITSLIPEDMDEGRADRLFDYAVERLRKHVATKKVKRIEPTEVAQLLADLHVFEDFGINPAPAGAAPPAKSATSSTPARAQAPAAPGKGPSPTREQVQKRIETRKAAAATAPAGAGAGVAGSAPPKGQTFEQRLAWLKGRK